MLKTLQFIGAILLLGGPLFQMLIWRPALAHLPDDRKTPLDAAVAERVRTGAALSFALLAVASVWDLFSLAAVLARSSLLTAATASKLAAVLLQTERGPIVALRILLAVGAWAAARRTAHVAALLVGVAVIASFSLTGHAVSTPTAGGPVIASDFVHFLAAAAWAGGLCYFALLPWRDLTAEETVPAVRIATARFSLLGLTAVAILFLTGVFMSTRYLYGITALVETRFGLDLLWKIGFFAVALSFAAHSLFVARPQLQHAAGDAYAATATRPLIRNARYEAVAVLAVIAAAGYMSTQPPPFRVPMPVGPIMISEFRFVPNRLEIPRGKPVRLTLENRDPLPHTWLVKRIPYEGLRGHVHDPTAETWEDLVIELPPRSVTSGAFTALEAGTYEFFDVLEDYKDRGMTGTLVVK